VGPNLNIKWGHAALSKSSGGLSGFIDERSKQPAGRGADANITGTIRKDMAENHRPVPPEKDDQRKPMAEMPFELEDLIAAGVTAILVKPPRKRRILRRVRER
jgi:hypothetical protein